MYARIFGIINASGICAATDTKHIWPNRAPALNERCKAD